MKRAAILVLGMAQLAVAAGAHAQPLRPTISVIAGSSAHELTLRMDKEHYSHSRHELQTSLALGLEHPLPADFQGHMSVGVGTLWTTGSPLWTVREDARFSVDLLSGVRVSAGLGAGLALPSAAMEHSRFEIAVPIAVVLADTVELVYRPYLELPLGSRTTSVYGGKLESSAMLAFIPFELQLRVRTFRISL